MYRLIPGDNLQTLTQLIEEGTQVDSVVTDAPYGLRFMNKRWDYDVPSVKLWELVYQVLKPGGHVLSFGGTRTYHRMVVNLEDAGFEIRDQLVWLYGSGFPKSLDIGKATQKADWQGWGTSLKPAMEPIVLARKPLEEDTIAANVLKYRTGGINIDGSRIGTHTNTTPAGFNRLNKKNADQGYRPNTYEDQPSFSTDSVGRFPANVLLDEDASAQLDQEGGFTKSGAMRRVVEGYDGNSNTTFLRGRSGPHNQHGDSGGVSRFFYCAKASAKERRESKHPTVKPVALMRYLCRLITPPGGVVLDPYAGSGSTGEAAVLEGFNPILLEIDPIFCDDIKRRMEDVELPTTDLRGLFE